MPVLVLVLVLVGIGACSDDDAGSAGSGPPTSVSSFDSYGPPGSVAPLGTAAPASAHPGSRITVTPGGAVDRRCLDTAGVTRIEGDEATPVGFLGPEAVWQPADAPTPPTFLACGPAAASAAPASYVVPDVPAGSYRICLWDTAASCAALAIG